MRLGLAASSPYFPRVASHEEQLAEPSAFNQVTVPDLWQQQAVTALRTAPPADHDRAVDVDAGALFGQNVTVTVTSTAPTTSAR